MTTLMMTKTMVVIKDTSIMSEIMTIKNKMMETMVIIRTTKSMMMKMPRTVSTTIMGFQQMSKPMATMLVFMTIMARGPGIRNLLRLARKKSRFIEMELMTSTRTHEMNTPKVNLIKKPRDHRTTTGKLHPKKTIRMKTEMMVTSHITVITRISCTVMTIIIRKRWQQWWWTALPCFWWCR